MSVKQFGFMGVPRHDVSDGRIEREGAAYRAIWTQYGRRCELVGATCDGAINKAFTVIRATFRRVYFQQMG